MKMNEFESEKELRRARIANLCLTNMKLWIEYGYDLLEIGVIIVSNLSIT